MKKLGIIFTFSLLILIACEGNSSEIKELGNKVKIEDTNNNSNDLAFLKKKETSTQSIETSRRNALTNAIEKVSPAVVGINVTEVRQVVYRGGSLMERFFGIYRDRIREYEVKGLGSGFIISPDGYILTNDHVAGNAKKVVVTMKDGKKMEAELIGSDPRTDITLLKVESDEDLPYIEMANSDDVIIGEWAIALGNPFGLFDNNAKPTVTVGVVSNTGLSFYNRDEYRETVYRNMIQTDAAISSGNSGGPLVNAEGKVIGMNAMIFSTANSRMGAGSIGIGFAIPINRVKKVIGLLKKNKTIDRDFSMGITIKELDENIIDYLDLDETRGVVIFEMRSNSLADKYELQPGDVILEIDGNRILREEDYYVYVNDAMVGQTLEFVILRDGEKKTIDVTLEKYKSRRRYR